MGVVKMSKFKDVCKIEGKDFNRLKTLQASHDEEEKQMREEYTQRMAAFKEELWDMIYEITGTSKKMNLTFDSGHEEFGFYVLRKEGKHSNHSFFSGTKSN